MFQFNRHWICICLGVIILSSLTSIAEEPVPREPDSQPAQENPEGVDGGSSGDYIDIRSEELDEDETTGTTVFTGHVKIVRPNGYLNADKVTVHRDVTDRSVIKMVAEGHVDMKEGELTAVCKTAIFDEIKDTVELKESVVVLQGADRLEADEVFFDRKAGRRKARGRVRVRAALQTKSDESVEVPDEEDEGLQ